uniref:Leucine rich repeat protein GP150 n=1 Tax=Drosophila melanogaster TaxID=7227 RepID=Q95PA9_DROME|nr:leucine rich repeat protein GP150 [Drosophila melanogaster]
MSRQSTCRLVLLLAFTLALIHASHSNTVGPKIHFIHDDLTENELNSGEEVSPTESLPKISTPKVKDLPVETTTRSPTKKTTSSGTEKSLSEEAWNDLMEAAKHSQALADDPHFNKMLNTTVAAGEKNSTDTDDSEYYDYDDDYHYFDEETVTISPSPKKAKSNPKLQPIVDATITKSKSKSNDQKTKESANDIDSDSQYDYDEGLDDDDDEDDAADDLLTDDEQVVFSEDVPCPRFCQCARNVNSYLVATCSRLDMGIQKFGSDITDLVVTNVGPKYPILMGPNFFQNLGLKNVASIKIANCTLEYLHAEAFHGLNELYAVNLTDVGLAIINPDTFVGNKKLRMLTISGNDLSVMSSIHYLLKSSSIEELDFSRNNLMELNPKAFSHLSNVVYINLSQNSLKKLPEKAFEKVTLLEELDLSYNSLTELPRDIFNGTTLSILHLKYNTSNGDLHFGTKDLQQLDLSFNSIVQVHHSMFDKMPGLTNLNLKGNGIKKIQPDSFLTLKNLRHIDLSINDLDQISGMLFFKNSELDVIRLNDNPRLSQLPTDGFLSYSGEFTVYYLDISNCAIGPLGHKAFSTMPHLTTLKLAWNNINHLPREIFTGLHKLIDLDLSNNLITRMDDLIFMDNGELTKLSLAGNPISRLSVRLFLPLHQLRCLDVNDCELTTLLSDRDLGAGYKIFDSLRSFNASGNLIKKISSEDVKSFKNLRSLDITNNPLKCTPDFQEFISYVTLQMQMTPKRLPVLANLEDDATIVQLETLAQAGWSSLAHEVCKHAEGSDLLDEKKADSAEAKLEKRLKESVKKLNEDEAKLLSVLDKSVLDKSRLSSMQKIMKGSVNTETAKPEEDADEENLNNGGEDKEDDSSDYDSEEDDDDDDEDDDDDNNDDDRFEEAKKNAKAKADANKAFDTFVNKELKPVLKTDGIQAEEVDMSQETRDKFLLEKLGFDSESEESDEYTEKMIFHGELSYDLVVPLIVVSFCLLMIVLSIARVIYVVLRKRGERYRMALLASKNSFVYQKLSEDIVKPTSKEQKEPKHLKQPKVHRYAPINQV